MGICHVAYIYVLADRLSITQTDVNTLFCHVFYRLDGQLRRYITIFKIGERYVPQYKQI